MANTISTFLLAEGFFAKELPSEFNSLTLSETKHLLDLSKSTLSNAIYSKWTKLVNFSIPKKGHFRRIASVPHPLHFLRLANDIESAWSELEIHYSKSTVSLSKLDFVDNVIKHKSSFGDKQKVRIEHLASNRYILSVDINRYYPSIYTHTIPWCLHTKAIAKQKPINHSLLGNKIDKHIRNMQDGQTMGIPIGPLTSSIIQEIIGTSIDAEFQQQMDTLVPGFRYTDDIEYFFHNFEEANKALSVITKILKEYNLDTNAEKTKILEIPLEIEAEWVYIFRNYKFKTHKTREIAISIQNRQLKEYFNYIFKFKINFHEKGISKYALKVLHNKIICHKENWPLYQSLLLQTALIDSSVIPTVFQIIESYKYKGYEINTEKLKSFVDSLVNENSLLNNDYEIIWSLSLANKFDLNLNENSSLKLSTYENALVNIMVMVLYDKGLLHDSIDFTKYRFYINQDDLYDEHWIFLYECCRNNWLGKTQDILLNDRFFKQLHENDVTFINPEASNAKLQVTKVICEKCIEKYEQNDNLELQEVLINFTDEYQISLESDHQEEILELLESLVESHIDPEKEIFSDDSSSDVLEQKSSASEQVDHESDSPVSEQEASSSEEVNNKSTSPVSKQEASTLEKIEDHPHSKVSEQEAIIENKINNSKEKIIKFIEKKYNISFNSSENITDWKSLLFLTETNHEQLYEFDYSLQDDE